MKYFQYGRDDFERGYQQLVKEHMELEKSYSMLQSDAGQPDWKLKVTINLHKWGNGEFLGLL